MSVLELTPAALRKVAPAVKAMATAEGLEAHWRAVQVRVEGSGSKSGSQSGSRSRSKGKG
jgi:histidinol dehydrogenase